MWTGLAFATQIPQTPKAAVATAEEMAQMRAEHELAIIEHSHPSKHLKMVDSAIYTPVISKVHSVIKNKWS